ncbi:hypothetical protein J3F84DRAFT_396503 [Trichoderma pleuroticola]
MKLAKKENRENEEVQRIKEDIELITEKLGPLKQEIMDFILLSLWDDLKLIQKRELDFSSQLDKLIELLVSAEKIPMSKPNISALSNPQKTAELETPEDHIQQSGTATSVMAGEETARLRNALQPLIQPGTGPVSLKQLANDITEYLQLDNRAMNKIRGELVNILWKIDWKLDSSMTLAKMDTAIVAHAIATGIQFSNIQTREEAISKTFGETYSWIFLDEPPTKDDIPIWSSFPKWLQDDFGRVYWITGKPGSGKSTMMKLISQEASVRDTLSQSLGSLRLLLVKYYAWLPGSALQKSIEGLKKAIIYQALEQYPDLAPILAPRRWVFCQVLGSILGLPAWYTWEVEESFGALLSLCGKTIKLVLFVDGLDEFDTPASEVVKTIQHITATCNTALKICAASRPWTEFQDEFHQSPMLQMNLLTENDMNIFVGNNFKNNRGFVEQRQLNPEAASQLLADIVQRVNGVFYRVLEALPTSLSSLYDVIWACIRPNNLPDASYMIQVLRAYDGPMPWLTLWVIEESRFSPIRASFIMESNSREVALRSLRRKLAARTKCILEVSGGETLGCVDFVHRTARDWAIQPENWQLICSSSEEQLDPHLCILKAETLISTDRRILRTITKDDVWQMIVRILWHAGEAKDIPKNTRDINECLHSFENIFRDFRLDYYKPRLDGGRRTPQDIRFYKTTFLALVTQFSILPYIRTVTIEDWGKLSLYHGKYSVGVLESAIFGYSYHMKFYSGGFRPQIPRDRRLAAVKLLLDQGVHQSKLFAGLFGVALDLREELQKILPTDPEYYSTVAMYLDEINFKSTMRHIELRARRLMTYPKVFWDAWLPR